MTAVETYCGWQSEPEDSLFTALRLWLSEQLGSWVSDKHNNRRGEARNEDVLAVIREKQRSTVQDIAESTGRSISTVQRALNELDRLGTVIWRKGGDVTLTQPSALREQSEKNSRSWPGAAEIAQLIQNGQAAILDSGPFSLSVAEAIDSKFSGEIYTNSPAIAELLAKRSAANVHVIGGRLKNGALIPSNDEFRIFEDVSANPCVLDRCSISTQQVSISNSDVLPIKKAMLSHARVVVVPVSSEALNRTESFIVGPISKITHLVLQNGAVASDVAEYEELGIKIIRA